MIYNYLIMKKNLLPGTCVIFFNFFMMAYASGGNGYELSHSRRSDSENRLGLHNNVCSGVNIHFITGHEKDLDMIAAAGIKFIRTDFIWQNTEPVKGIYNWSAYDELTANLEKRGLRAVYILDYSNSLYEDTVDSKDPITGEVQIGIAAPRNPESIAAYASWAAAAAEHFKKHIVIWEIWNEPNITFWRPSPDVNRYITLAMGTCKAIRSLVPDALIIGPATSQIPLPFIESFLASGILEYIDGVSVHPYRDYAESPETAVSEYNKIRELIDRYTPVGKREVPVISSEWGYASATKGISVETQAAYIVRMQLANLLYGVPLSIWYDWKNDGDQPGNFEHNCGTVMPDLTPKPAYTAISTMNSQLKGFTLLERIKLENENDFILLFRNDNGTCKMVAWTIDQQHTVKIDKNISDSGKSMVTDWKGNSVSLYTDNGRLILNLDNHPKYITLPAAF